MSLHRNGHCREHLNKGVFGWKILVSVIFSVKFSDFSDFSDISGCKVFLKRSWSSEDWLISSSWSTIWIGLLKTNFLSPSLVFHHSRNNQDDTNNISKTLCFQEEISIGCVGGIARCSSIERKSVFSFGQVSCVCVLASGLASERHGNDLLRGWDSYNKVYKASINKFRYLLTSQFSIF